MSQPHANQLSSLDRLQSTGYLGLFCNKGITLSCCCTAAPQSRCHFTNAFLSTNQILWKLCVVIQLLANRSHHILAHAMTAQLSVSCVTFCNDHFARIKARAKQNYHWILIVKEKTSVKWAPGVKSLLSGWRHVFPGGNCRVHESLLWCHHVYGLFQWQINSLYG